MSRKCAVLDRVRTAAGSGRGAPVERRPFGATRAMESTLRRILVTMSIALSACTIVRTPHLFPVNDIAKGTGVLSGTFVGHGHLHGTAEFSMPDGELIRGQYSIVAGGSIGVGNIFSAVYGPAGGVSSAGIVSTSAISARGQGFLSVYGPKGTSMECEFLNNNFTGHGYGACKSSTGGLYRMLY
jgi:hypothetical protein